MTPPPATYSERITRWVFSVALVLGAALLLAAGPAPQLLYPSDDVTYLDACHRAAIGQWLGRDFSSPIGPAALLPVVMAMKAAGTTVQALVLGSALSWLGFGTLAWGVARLRMPAWLAAGFALFVSATAAALYTLDFGRWNVLSYGILYNRLAWAALSIAACAALLPRTDGSATRLLSAGLGAGAIWLWAIKPNYLLIFAPLILYHWLPGTGRAHRLLGIVLGALAMLGLLFLCVRFSPVGYVRTHLGIARTAAQGGGAIYDLERSLRENLWPVAALVATWLAVLRVSGPGSHRSLAVVLAGLVVCTLAGNLANNQFSEIPLWGALGWLAAACVTRMARVSTLARAALVGGLVCGLAFTWQPLASIAYNYAWKSYRAPGHPPAAEITGSAWHGLPMRPMPGEPTGPAEALEIPANYAAWLNDGLALLARVQPPQGAVLCLDWANPFPFATQSVPPQGDEIAWHVGRTVGPDHHPEVARLLADTAVVMEPFRSVQPGSLAFKRVLFAPALTASFVMAGETAQWRAWIRRGASAPAFPVGH